MLVRIASDLAAWLTNAVLGVGLVLTLAIIGGVAALRVWRCKN